MAKDTKKKETKEKESKVGTPEKENKPKQKELTTPKKEEPAKDNKENRVDSKEKKVPKDEEEVEEKVVDQGETVENKKEDKKKHNIVLTYFDGSGRAELSRLILSAAGMDFEDRRITTEEWAQLKPDTPFSQLPILEYHGVVLGQSTSIARFLAKKANLYGKDELEQAFVDGVVDYVIDYNNKWVSVFRTNVLEERIDLIQNIFVNFLPRFFLNIEKLLEKVPGKFFAGDNLTYADIALFQILWAFSDPEDPFLTTLPYVDDRLVMLQDYPRLLKHREDVFQVPGVKKWIETRPMGLF